MSTTKKIIEAPTTTLKSVTIRGQAFDIGALGFKITASMLQTTRIDLNHLNDSTMVFDAEQQMVLFSDGKKTVLVPASAVLQMEIL